MVLTPNGVVFYEKKHVNLVVTKTKPWNLFCEFCSGINCFRCYSGVGASRTPVTRQEQAHLVVSCSEATRPIMILLHLELFERGQHRQLFFSLRTSTQRFVSVWSLKKDLAVSIGLRFSCCNWLIHSGWVLVRGYGTKTGWEKVALSLMGVTWRMREFIENEHMTYEAATLAKKLWWGTGQASQFELILVVSTQHLRLPLSSTLLPCNNLFLPA